MRTVFFHSKFSHSLFMGLCAFSLIFLSSILSGVGLTPFVYFVLAWATCSVYQLYWLISDSKAFAGLLSDYIRNNIIPISFVSFSLIFCLLLFAHFQLINTVFLFLFICVCIYFLLPSSNRLFTTNRFVKGFLKTILLAVIWTIATDIFPFPSFRFDSKAAFLILSHRFIFLLTLSLLFDRRDRQSDCLSGRNTLATLFSDKQLDSILLLLTSLLLCFTLLVFSVKFSFKEFGVLMYILTPVLLCLLPLFGKGLNRYYYLALDGLMIYFPLVFYINLL